MDEGAVVLVDLEPRKTLSDLNARMLGTLITNDLFLNARNRPEGSPPFYFYIDECGRYLNESIERILDEARKHGLHLVLANQHLSQIQAAGDKVYSAVTTDAQTKVIFGGLCNEDRDTFVKEVFLDLNLEQPKESLTRIAAVGQEKVVLRSGGVAKGKATGRSKGAGTHQAFATGISFGDGESESVSVLSDGMDGGTTLGTSSQFGSSQQETYGSSYMETESESESESETAGWAESFRTIYEKVTGGVYTLEEQRYLKSSWLKKQPTQSALLVRPDLTLQPFTVATVQQAKVPEEYLEEFVEERYKAFPFVERADAILTEIARRGYTLQKAAGLPVPVAYCDEPDPFDPFDNE